ncbi:hypothetical protein GOP47_0013759 [Adiantum capillus-veneris]|uniref:Glycylpeptide N-tetradecanoyltransferase n=1 Tax=Adiantum capillus-veneris TaxID=13818 RepID=A0A9D4UQC9_ADICA|nr:hypothetical protein GOP47_0013759 [Adiantum capillus-veneris]
MITVSAESGLQIGEKPVFCRSLRTREYMASPGGSSRNNGNNEESSSGENEGLMKMGRKDVEDLSRSLQRSLNFEKRHAFWETQPVGQYRDRERQLEEGPIDPPQDVSEIRQEPYNLPKNFEWCTCDVNSDENAAEIYNLLSTNYVEDDENMFRFNYSKEFLRWALQPPGWCCAPDSYSNLTIKLYRLPDTTATPGFRPMERHDVPAVRRLLHTYLSQFVVAPDLSEKDVEYWLLPIENVISSYVVEDPDSREITDFCSFYTLPSTILGNKNYSDLKAAYSYYNVATKTPLLQLMNDALIVAKRNMYDVFNALDIMHNQSFLKELKFGPGDGHLHYYLYNYRLNTAMAPSGLGLVLL